MLHKATHIVQDMLLPIPGLISCTGVRDHEMVDTKCSQVAFAIIHS